MTDLERDDHRKEDGRQRLRRPGIGRQTLARWWSGQGALPTTVAGVELSLVTVFLLIRLTDLVQLSIAAHEGLLRSTRPDVDAAVMLFYLAESLALSAVLIKARRYSSARWATVDTLSAVLILLSQSVFTSPTDRVGTWVAWGFAISIGASVGVGIGFPHRWQTAAGVAALAASYVVVSLPSGALAGSAATVWSNAFGFVGFGVFGRTAGGYLRRLGGDADTARQQAAAAAAEAMFDRQRHLLHDQAGVLRQLAHPPTDPVVADLLRARAATAAVQIRQWLATPPTTELHGPTTLIGVVQRVVADAGDLPVTASLDLASGVTLAPKAAEAVRSAVSTVLDNIREHAHASDVLVHADTPVAGQWELVIRDNGIGFELDWSQVGFGLGTQVRVNLRRVDISVEVESILGEGTAITLRGCLEPGRP